MFGISDYPSFCLTVLLFLMLPGPGTFTLLTSTGQRGFKAGAAATLGIIFGDQVLLWAAVAGLAAIMAANPRLFAAVQWAGAAYLVWIGYQLLTAKKGDSPVIHIEPHHYLRQALLITLLNPKAIFFYMAFFPQFVNPATHLGLPTFVAMAITIALITLVYCLGLCALSALVAEKVKRHEPLAQLLQRLAGVFLIGFGIKLGLSK